MPADSGYRGEARARPQDGRYRRFAAVGCQVPQGCDRDRDRGDAIGHRHCALHQGRTPPARKIPPRLRVDMADRIVVRPVGKGERAAWEPLWKGYLAFYKAMLA